MEKFDELFNDFLGKKDEKIPDLNDKVKDVIKMIETFKTTNPEDEQSEIIDGELDDKLGTPDEIKYYTEDDIYFEKRIWYMEHGMIIKTISSTEPLEPQPKLTLDEQLKIAIESEDYETASAIRDLIKKEKAKNRRELKKLLK